MVYHPNPLYLPLPLFPQGLEGTIEKISPSLNVNATYNKVSRVSRLPAYLNVQYMRFYVGKTGDSDEIVSKKILKVSELHGYTANSHITHTCTHTHKVFAFIIASLPR